MYQVCLVLALSFLFSASSVWAQEKPLVITSSAAKEGTSLFWTGDLRYRLNRSAEGSVDPNLVHQLRARFGFRAELDSNLSGHLRLATATSPVSANQALGPNSDPGFSRRSFGVDQAWIRWSTEQALKLNLGRVANPYWHPGGSQLLFDSDLNFEGLSAQYESKDEALRYFVNAGGFLISNNYDSATGTDTADLGIMGLQVGAQTEWGNTKIKLHLAHQNFANIQDAEITSLSSSARFDSLSQPRNSYRGNSVYAVDPTAALDDQEFRMSNKFAINILGFESRTKFRDFEFLLIGDLAQNGGVSDDNVASELGFRFATEDSELGVAWIRKESDSVVGAYSDSNANGGGVDNQGVRYSISHDLTKNLNFVVKYFRAERGLKGTSRNFEMAQVDTVLSF